ncbi:MAG: hypothetical protein LBS21_01170 [Clostridiales bacterium]|jgi:hypothetical protein|nr:hypothetical protein [Clostridiales bacterium]
MNQTNELVERYLYDVTRRLPEKERGEVGLELRTSINDMLGDNPNDSEITQVLEKLGDPQILSESYRSKPRYLISPAIYDLYISVLKTVVVIVAAVCGCAGIVSIFFSDAFGALLEGGTYAIDSIELIGGRIGSIISAMLDGALQAALWVTLGFAIADRTGGYKAKTSWSVSNLPKMPAANEAKIPRASSITGMVLTVFFTLLLIAMILQNKLYFVFSNGHELINPFSRAALVRFLPYLALLGVMGFLMNGAKLFWGKWNIPLCVLNAIYNFATVSITIYVLHWEDLFSAEFLAFMQERSGSDTVVTIITSGGLIALFSAVFILGAVVNVISAAVKTFKGMRN